MHIKCVLCYRIGSGQGDSANDCGEVNKPQIDYTILCLYLTIR